jgi:ABC-type spermidine/putrescine transport system permease subunit II
MNTILVAVGSGIVAFIIALIVSYILPREKVRAANQLLN